MMAEREIKTVLTLEDASFSKGLKAATSNVSAIRAEMQAAVAGASGLGKGMKQWKAQVTGLSSALKSQKQQMSLLNKQYTEQKKKLADAEKALKDAKKAHGENSDEVRRAANAYAHESAQVDELRTRMARLSMQMSQDQNVLNQRLTQPLKMAASAVKTFGIVVGTSMAAAGAALVALGKKSLDARQQLNADISASQATFGVWSNFIEQDAVEAWKNVGLSTDAYLQNAVAIGEYLEAAGMPVQENASLTSQLLQRAADLAGVYGTSTSDALDAIKQAAKGSYENMRRYGLSLNSASIKQWALNKGLISVGENLTAEQERAFAVQMILEKTADAAGGFATRTDNVTAALGTASAAWDNFIDGTGSADSVVQAFSQAAAAVAREITNLTPQLVEGVTALIAGFVENLPEFIETLTPAAGTLIDGILEVLAENSDEIGEAAGTFVGHVAAWLITNAPKLVSSAVKMVGSFLTGFLSAARTQWRTNIWPALQKVMKITFGVELPDWETMKTELANGWNSIKEFVGNLFKAVFTLDYPSWEKVDADIRAGWGAYQVGINKLFHVAFGVDLPKWEEIGGAIDMGWGNIWGGLSYLFEVTFGVKMPEWEKVKESISVGWQGVTGTWGNMFRAVFGVDMPSWEGVLTTLQTGWGTISETVGKLFRGEFSVGLPSWEGVAQGISTGWDSVWESISGLFSTIFFVGTPDWAATGEAISTGWDSIQDTVTGLFRAVFGVELPTWDTIAEDISTGWSSAWDGISSLFQATLGVNLPTWDTIAGDISTGWDGIQGTVSGLFRAAFGVDLPSWDSISTAISTGWDGIQGTVSGLFHTAFGVDLPSWDGIAQSISGGWDSIKETVSGLFHGTFDIHIPSWDEVAADWATFCQNLYNNLPGWLKDILNFFGIGGGEAQSGETALNAAANSLADTVTEASASIRGLGSAAKYASTGLYGEEGEIHHGTSLLTGKSASDLTKEDAAELRGLLRQLNSLWERGAVDEAIKQLSVQSGPMLYKFLSAEMIQSIKNASPGDESNAAILERAFSALNLLLIQYDRNAASGKDAMESAAQSAKEIAENMGMAGASADQLVEALLQGANGSHAGGSWNVPFDNYIARLHAGEMVLTADQARRYRAQAAAGNTYNDSASIYIDKYNQYSGADADALLAQMQAMQRRRRMGYGLA